MIKKTDVFHRLRCYCGNEFGFGARGVNDADSDLGDCDKSCDDLTKA